MFVLGSTVLLIGIALIVLPGPAVVVIPAGLAILSTEFLWARRVLKNLKGQATGLAERFGMRRTSVTPSGATDDRPTPPASGVAGTGDRG